MQAATARLMSVLPETSRVALVGSCGGGLDAWPENMFCSDRAPDAAHR
jgi:hypothetical protein